MTKRFFNTIEEFVGFAFDFYNSVTRLSDEDEICDMSIVARYEEATEIIKHLILHGENIVDIDIENPDSDGYEDEFIISCDTEGIWCEKMRRENGYLNAEDSAIFVLDNCNSALLSHCRAPFIWEVAIEDTDVDAADDEEFDCTLDTCKPFCARSEHLDVESDEDDNLHSITFSSNTDDSYFSLSFSCNDSIKKEDVDSLYAFWEKMK